MVRLTEPAAQPGLALRRETAFLLIAAAAAWAATVALARGMAGMTGTMGLGLVVFVPAWTLMMAAMMLPSVTPVATLYARTFQGNRAGHKQRRWRSSRSAGRTSSAPSRTAAWRTAAPRSGCSCTTARTGAGFATCGSVSTMAGTAWAAAGR